MDLNHHSLSTCPRVNWTVLPETEMFCFWSRWDLPSLGNLLTWAQGSSDWLMPNVMWKTGCAHWSPRLMGTHPPLEKLGWQAWPTTHSFLLRGGPKIANADCISGHKGRLLEQFSVSKYYILDWPCWWRYHCCVNTQIVLLPLWKKWGETYRCDLLSSCWGYESEPQPSGGICPLQRSNSFSSRFCSSLVKKCPLIGKMKLLDRSFKKEARLQAFVCTGADLTCGCYGLFGNLSPITASISSAGWK